ncbi:MAG: hypothetical protein Q8P95_01590 [bacterium]|nr:hypothetical protein [bacterium]
MPDITRTCRITGKLFTITEWEQEFYKKMGVTPPTLCIEERHRRRLSHRNERTIYKGQCSLCAKAMISIYSPDKLNKVYCPDCWWSDKWDPRDFGRDIDFNRPFFDQFAELQRVVPQIALFNLRGENSEYCNITNSNKNCYLVFGGDYCEDCMNSCFSMYCKDVSDVYWTNHSELCFDCIDCGDCYNVRYSQGSYNCKDSDFLFECRACTNCFGCVGLRNKEYHIFNKPYSKEEYHQKIQEYQLHSWSGVQRMKQQFEEFRLRFPHRAAQIINCENSSGDDLRNCKNCSNCFDVEGPAEDLKDCFLAGWGARDMVSCDHGGFGAQLYYEMVGSIEGQRCAFCTFCWTSSDIWYSHMIVNNSHDLFGCSNMKKAEYCILNKQYSKEEYFSVRQKLVDHMKKTGEFGEFFPIANSLFSYNETVANDYFSVSKEEALRMNWKWCDFQTPVQAERTIPAEKLPDSIQDIPDDILNWAILCERTGRPFKIIAQELKYYRRMKIPIPHLCPEERNRARIRRRKPRTTWERECDKCQKTIFTPYRPECPEKIYCEQCYLNEVE